MGSADKCVTSSTQHLYLAPEGQVQTGKNKFRDIFSVHKHVGNNRERMWLIVNVFTVCVCVCVHIHLDSC